MTPLEILKAAQVKIEKPESWGKGRRGHGGRSIDTCCVGEAIEDVSGCEYDARNVAFRTFQKAAGLERKWGSLVKWNDDPDRIHSEVIATFNLAIALQRDISEFRRRDLKSLNQTKE